MFFNFVSPALKNIIPTATRSIMTCSYQQPVKGILSNGSQQNCLTSIKPDNFWSLDTFRTNVRNHFPYPREHKRLKVHGYLKRMSTRSGRAILMRRILKGRHTLSH